MIGFMVGPMIGFMVGPTNLAAVGALFTASSWPRNSDTESTLPRTRPRMIQGPCPDFQASLFSPSFVVLHDAWPSRNNRHPRRRPIPGRHALVIGYVDAVGKPQKKEACQDKEVLPNRESVTNLSRLVNRKFDLSGRLHGLLGTGPIQRSGTRNVKPESHEHGHNERIFRLAAC